MTSFRTALLALFLALSPAAGAQGLLGPASNQDQFLPVDEAFRFSASADGAAQVALDWQVAPGYYLYRHRVSAKTGTEGFALGAIAMPPGKKKTDEFFGDVEVYYDALSATVPVTRPAGASRFEIAVTYQGCADAGLCYPPVTKTVSIELPPPGTPPRSESPPMVAEQDSLASFVASGGLLAVMGWFWLIGLGLSYTPCVLPMVPILSGIIAGQGTAATPRRSFLLSLTYVLGMAFTYTIAGAAFAAAGQQAQALFQQPWIIISLAGLFVVLALAMFGLFDLKMPAALETRLAAASGRQKSGTFVGTAIMGAISALVVTACVAPALVAALTVISQGGDVLRGALALFAMSLGMGTPLLLVGVAGGRFLPHAGPWMTSIKTLFGVLFLAVAVWMLSRILAEPLTLALWGLLVIVSGYYFGGFGRGTPQDAAPHRLLVRGTGLAAIVWGVIMLLGAAAGGHDPFQPLRGAALPGFDPGAPAAGTESLPFVTVASIEELDRELAAAQAAGQPAMLDFYADWCVSCKEMEKYTFPAAGVRQDLAGFVLLKADVTANNEADQALLRRFGVYGPPTTAFFGPHGRECRAFRLVGYVPADEFREHLARFAREC